ncbi:MAG TPA: DNA-3-methyladenine glycosylase [Actinomycetaceae bacterium]|nr:DNA-3-methyladenine glycosylase [Actinomycetaceae bacterium]
MNIPGYRRADRAEYDRPVLQMAPLLLGGVLLRDGAAPVAVRLTEVEAYAGAVDPGSHSFRGRTARNATMFGPPGHLYCYFTYGMHHALNVVCDKAGIATGCLLRAGEVVVGLEMAHRRREAPPGHTVRTRLRPLSDDALARGPGNLARVLGATRAATDGTDLCDPASGWSLWLPDEPPPAAAVRNGPRVGVAGEGGDGERYPWRFYLTGEPTVSQYRPAAPRP